jgi:hypothetical protein
VVDELAGILAAAGVGPVPEVSVDSDVHGWKYQVSAGGCQVALPPAFNNSRIFSP